MSFPEFAGLILASALVNHIVLVQLLGVSSFFAYSGSVRQALELSLAVLLIMPLTVGGALAVYSLVLEPLGLELLLLTVAVLFSALFSAALVQCLRRHFPLSVRRHQLAFLLVGGNSAILGFVLLSRDITSGYLRIVVSGIGTALGFALLLIAFAALRQRLDVLAAPAPFRGAPLYLISAGLAAMGLLGLA